MDKLEARGEKLTQDGPAIAFVWRYSTQVKIWTIEEVNSLIDKGLLVNRSHASGHDPDMLEVTDLFAKSIFVTLERFELFWDLYPAFIPNFTDPRKAPINLKACDKDGVEMIYRRKIANLVTHDRLIEATKWAKENGRISINIENWLRSESWKEIEKERKQGTPDLKTSLVFAKGE